MYAHVLVWLSSAVTICADVPAQDTDSMVSVNPASQRLGRDQTDSGFCGNRLRCE
jgi:hypothetical protein